MVRGSFLAFATSLASFSLAKDSTSSFVARCRNFDALKYADARNYTVNAHEYLPAGSLLSLPDFGCGKVNQNISVDTCRIALNISTSPRSGVLYEGWFPANWTGRFMTTGNGGIDGCIKYDDINYGLLNGFSAVGSNNGHNGSSGLSFYHNDEVLKDYVYRSLHTITEVGKNLAEAFYGSAPRKSYYLGCSGGGRQGLRAAEAFPTDFDGILIGAPASNFNNMTSWRASFLGKTGAKNSPNFISADIWKGLIHEEILRQCDTIDGVNDGIIENPALCDFRAEVLLCGNSGLNQTSCLSRPQVEIVTAIFSPLYGSSGELVWPAMQPGSEVLACAGLYSGTPWPYSLDWFRYVVYNNPSWDDSTFNVSDITAAAALNPFNVSTFPTDLTPFTSAPHDGKMLIYYGQQDQQISSFATSRLMDHLSLCTPRTVLDDSVRAFQISGMGHCSGGPGAWMIGQTSGGNLGFDPESNVLAALVAWVEDGKKPDTVVGTKFVNDARGGLVERRRRHCRYPYQNTFVGGDASTPEAWECVLI